MSKTIEAVYDGKVFLPDKDVGLKPNTRVEITIEIKNDSTMKSKSFLETARSLRLQGPKDFSTNLDEYLYGGKNIDDKYIDDK